MHRHLQYEDAHRRLPRRGPARGHLRYRADDGRARGRAWRGPARSAGAELDLPRGVPVHHDRRADLRLGQLRGGHGRGQGAVPLRRAAPGAGGADRQERPGPARHRRLDVHRDVRARAVAGARVAVLRSRRLGERVDPDAADRQGRGGDRVERARPGSRDRVEPDRGRPARSAVRGHPGAARRHPDLTEGHGHLRIALASRGRHGPGRRVRQGRGQGQGDRRGHDRGLRRRPGVDAGAVLGPRRPGEGCHDRRDRARHVRRAQPA